MSELDFLHKVSEWLYGWLLNANHSDYVPIYANQIGGGYGQSYLLLFLLIVAIVTPLVYYFGVAKNATNATKKNYIIVYLLGYFVLIVMNYFGLAAFVDSTEVFTNVDMIKVCLIDAVYYSIICELISYFSKGSPHTAANNIDLITCWK